MELNLCKILEGHEGKIFYCSAFGNITLREIDLNNTRYPIIMEGSKSFTKDGKFHIDEECVLFPSKDQRDWNKWVEEQKSKVPKTWEELLKQNKAKIFVASNLTTFGIKVENTPIEKAALAIMKIHHLIEVSYGGNITNDEWNSPEIDKFVATCENNRIDTEIYNFSKQLIAFHTEKQVHEFLSYPENVQLVKDFFMIK